MIMAFGMTRGLSSLASSAILFRELLPEKAKGIVEYKVFISESPMSGISPRVPKDVNFHYSNYSRDLNCIL